MIDPRRRARPFFVVAAALAVAVAASGAVTAQSPSPVGSATPSAAPASVAPGTAAPGSASSGSPSPSVAPASAAPSVASASAAPSVAPIVAAAVALLLASTTEPRWESVDRPAFSAKLSEVCPTAVLNAYNAGGDAALQTQQAQEALAAGVRVLVLDPVDAATGAAIATSARSAGASVISYDTPVTGAVVDYSIAYDPAAAGTVTAGAVTTSNSEAALDASPGPTSSPPAGVRVVLVDAPAADPSGEAWSSAVKAALDGEGTIVRETAATDLTPGEGTRIVADAISGLTVDGFDAVITPSDALASGVIAGLRDASADPATRQVTGGDATVQGVQSVLGGDMLLTTFAAPRPEAQLAAVISCGLATGEGLPEGLSTTPVNNGTADIPTLLLTPIAVTIDGSIAGTRSVADTIIAEEAFGPGTAALVCTGDYLTACTDNDITLPSLAPSSAAPSAPSPAPSSAAPSAPGSSGAASAMASPMASSAP